MKIDSPVNTIIYSIEKAIKSYRQFAQKNIQMLEPDITLDQALVLILIKKQPELSQMKMAEILFKDYASITRIIELMVQKNYLNRTEDTRDRRRHQISLSTKGNNTINKLDKVILDNRKQALNGLNKAEQEQLNSLLMKVIENCKKPESLLL